MTTTRIIAWSALALLGRILWNYLPFAVEAACVGEISWGELRPLFAYLVRADAGAVDYFQPTDAAPFMLAGDRADARH